MGSVSVAKSAVAAVMRTLALELGPKGIRVNVVAPGMVLLARGEGRAQDLLSRRARNAVGA